MKTDYAQLDLAPAPPTENLSLNDTDIDVVRIEPAAGAKETSKPIHSCNIKDRLDRGATLAYQWGPNQRSRLSLDIDGLNLSPFGGGSAKIERVKLDYKFKFQEHKTRKEKCRGIHRWQGMMGTGYREFIDREDGAVWDEIRSLRDQVF